MTTALIEDNTRTTSNTGVDVERVLFIAGVGRSGTSLLHSMLNAHPEVAFPPETHFFRRYIAAAGRRKAVEEESVDRFHTRLAQDADFARLSIAPETVIQTTASGRVDTLGTFRALLRTVAAREGKSRVGDKDPRHIDDIPALAGAFPHAILVHVYRDPREVLLSRTRAEWSRSRPWWLHALLAEDQLNRARSLGPLHFRERYVEVRYEDLLATPELVLRRITAAANLEYTPAMLDFSASAKSLVDSRERAWKSETLGPLLRNNTSKWRTDLSKRQVRFVEAVSRTAFADLSYERSERTNVLAPVAPLMRGFARSLFTVRRIVERSRC